WRGARRPKAPRPQGGFGRGRRPARRRLAVEPESEYGGIVTRGLAFAIDVALINLLFAVFGALVSLILSAFDSLPSSIDLSTVVVSATAWVIWASLYLASFWMLTGQTPGMRALGVAVERPDGTTIGRGRSVRR